MPSRRRKSRATTTEAKLLEAAKRVLPPQAIPFDADFFTDLGGHSLARGTFHLGRARNARARADHLAGRLHGAFAARDGRASRQEMGRMAPPPRISPSSRRRLLRRFLCGCAQAARAAGHPLARDRAMARRVRELHASDRRRCELCRGSDLAHRRLYVHQHRDRGDRHRREMAGDRQDPSLGAIRCGAFIISAGGW